MRRRPAIGFDGGMHDGALLRLAGRQHGLVTARQLASLGYTKDQIYRRLQAGVLFRVHRGVYAVAGAKDGFEFRVLAAILAAGDGALASHRCAAALFDLRAFPAMSRRSPSRDGMPR